MQCHRRCFTRSDHRANQLLCNLAALVPDVLADRCQVKILGHRVVVEADHRHVGGHPEPRAGEGAERTEGHFVRLCKNCGRKVAPAEQLDRCFVATLDGEGSVALEAPVGRQTRRLQGRPCSRRDVRAGR